MRFITKFPDWFVLEQKMFLRDYLFNSYFGDSLNDELFVSVKGARGWESALLNYEGDYYARLGRLKEGKTFVFSVGGLIASVSSSAANAIQERDEYEDLAIRKTMGQLYVTLY